MPVTVIRGRPLPRAAVAHARIETAYEAVQVGFLDKPRRLASRSERGHVAKLDSKRSRSLVQAGVELPGKADCEPQSFVREFRGARRGASRSASS